MNFSADELKAAAQHLEATGIIYQDPLFCDWCSAAGEELSLAQVEALCVAYLTTESSKNKGKVGRPKLQDGEKLKCISAMVSPTSYEQFHTKAKAFGLSVSALARHILDPYTEKGKKHLAHKMPKGLTVEEGRMRRELAGATSSLYQLAQQARAEGMLSLEAELLAACRDIRTIIAK